jgi:hypothetical protein
MPLLGSGAHLKRLSLRQVNDYQNYTNDKAQTHLITTLAMVRLRPFEANSARY